MSDVTGPVDVGDGTVEPRSTGSNVRRRGLVAAAGVALVLVAGSLVGLRVTGVWEPGDEPGSVATQVTAEDVSPFAGTPAEDFAVGAAGIVLPPAEPVGEFTAEEVGDALEQVRRALIAARLDVRMLFDHDPEPFLSTLAPDQRDGVSERFEDETFREFASQTSHDIQLAAPPRVAGSVSYRASTAEGDLPVLEVTTRLTWVYAFVVDRSLPASDSHLVAVGEELRWQVALDFHWVESSRGLWLVDRRAMAWGVDCAIYDRGLLRPGPGDDGGSDVRRVLQSEDPLALASPC